jgi:Protein of unknown function (DUF2800)
VEHALRSHKRFAASAASRWMVCPGSVRLCESLPEPPTNKFQLEGTLAHEWLQYKTVGGTAPKQEATQEMFDAAEEFKELVRSTVIYPASIIIEKPVELHINRDVGGTLDFGAYHEKSRTMWIIDFKFGAGVAVESFEQLMIYALGAIDTYGWTPVTIHLIIFQPRAFHMYGPVRAKMVSIVDLIDFEADVENAVSRCSTPDAPLVPGDRQCRWCAASTICPARERQMVALASEDFLDVCEVTHETMPKPQEMTPEHIGEILAKKKLVIDWLEAVEEKGYEYAMSGINIPGQKLVEPIGRRKWEGEPYMVAAKLSDITGWPKEIFLETKMLGVTEAEKLVKPHGKEAMKQFALLAPKSSNGKLQLVAENDPRPEKQPASQAFAGVIPLPQITTGNIS